MDITQKHLIMQAFCSINFHIQKSAVIFPKVFVAVANSPSKKPLFSLEERVELVRQSVAHLPNVEVFGFSDLLANEIKAKKITAIIRGVRTTTDFEYELQLAALNRLLTDGVDSLFLPTNRKMGVCVFYDCTRNLFASWRCKRTGAGSRLFSLKSTS